MPRPLPKQASNALTVAIVDLAFAATPVLSHCRALYEGASGKHLITGHTLDPLTRALALASCTPIAPHAHHAKMVRDACLSLGRAAAFCQKVEMETRPLSSQLQAQHLVKAIPIAAADFFSSHQSGLAQSRLFFETLTQKEWVTGNALQPPRGVATKAARVLPKLVKKAALTSQIGQTKSLTRRLSR